MYFLTFGTGIVRQLCRVLIGRKREQRWAEQALAEITARTGILLPEAVKKKVLTVYSIFQPMVIDAFVTLSGRSTSVDERRRMLQYFICSVTFDNFTDEYELTIEELEAIMHNPETFIPRTPQEKLFLQAHLALLDFVRDEEQYKAALHGLFNAQVDSCRQTDPHLPDEALYDITIGKGAFSVLLCSFYMNNDHMPPAWRQCWFQLGGIIQLTNDLFDTWKDLQAGIQTLPTRMKDARQLYQTFMQMVDELDAGIAALPVPEAGKQQFRLKMMAICSFGDMALRQFRDLQQGQDNLPALNTLPRKALIIDMEKPGNIWHCMRFAYRRCRQPYLPRKKKQLASELSL